MSTQIFLKASGGAGIEFTARLDPAAGPNPVARFWLYRLTDATHSELIGDSGPKMSSAHTFAISAAGVASWKTKYAIFEVDAQPALRGATKVDVLLTAMQNGATIPNGNQPPLPTHPDYLMTLTKDGVLNSEGFGLELSRSQQGGGSHD